MNFSSQNATCRAAGRVRMLWLWLVLVAGHQPAAAQSQAQTLAELKDLLVTYNSDYNTRERYDNAVHELATRPEFKPILLDMLQQDYFRL